MDIPAYIPARIQHRMGKRQDLPQPLMPGEIGYCTDTDQVFIGSDPYDTSGYASPIIKIYSDYVQSVNNGLYNEGGATYEDVANEIFANNLIIMDLDPSSPVPSLNSQYLNYDANEIMVVISDERVNESGSTVTINRVYIGYKEPITSPVDYSSDGVTGTANFVSDVAYMDGNDIMYSSAYHNTIPFSAIDTSSITRIMNWVYDNSTEYDDTRSEDTTYTFVANNIFSNHIFMIDLEDESNLPPINAQYSNTTDPAFMVVTEDTTEDIYGNIIEIKRAYIGYKSPLYAPISYSNNGVVGVYRMISDVNRMRGDLIDFTNIEVDGRPFGIQDTSAITKIINWVFDNSAQFSTIRGQGRSLATMGQNVELLTDRNRLFNEEIKTLLLPMEAGSDVSTGMWFSQYDSDVYNIKYSVKSENYLRHGELSFGMILNQSDIKDDYSEICTTNSFTQDITFGTMPVAASNNTAFELVYDATGLEPNTLLMVNIERWRSFVDSTIPKAISFQISSDDTVINEGDTATFNIVTSNFGSGTLYWTVLGTTNENDLNNVNGTVNIINDVGSFDVTAIEDLLTEGAETFQIQLRVGSTGGVIVATSNSVTINDTSNNPPSYDITPRSTSINEGSDLTVDVNVTNFGSGTLYWKVDNYPDDVDFGRLSDSVNIVNGVGSFTIPIIADNLTEGAETFVVRLMSGSTNGTVLASTGIITINDTSLSEISYSITPNVTTVNEGGTVILTVNTTNFGTGFLYWTVDGNNITRDDFTYDDGSVLISGDQPKTFSIGIAQDALTEGSEVFVVRLRTRSTSGTVVATSAPITISDTSTTPVATPSYTISTTAVSVNEGGIVTFKINTTNFGNGTLYWVLTGADSEDFVGTEDTRDRGSVNISNDFGSFTVQIAADQLTEGSESFRALLKTNSIAGTTVATSNLVTINDTSQSPAPVPTYSITPSSTTVNEGSSITMTVNTTNYGSGTLYWMVMKSYADGVLTQDFNLDKDNGSVSISSDTGSFTITTKADLQTEGNERFYVELREASIYGTKLAQSSDITIVDTSVSPPAAPTYSISLTNPAVTSFTEGQSVNFSINTTNFGSGTLYFDVFGTNIMSTDFLVFGNNVQMSFVGAKSGSFYVEDDYSPMIITLLDDTAFEATEYFQVNIRTGSATGPIVATSQTIAILENDVQTISFTQTQPFTVLEGSSTVMYVTTSNVNDGTRVYWDAFGQIDSSDLTSMTGSFLISSGIGSFTFTRVADLTTEGTETMQINLRTGSNTGPIVDTSPLITITDNSVPSSSGGGGTIDPGDDFTQIQ